MKSLLIGGLLVPFLFVACNNQHHDYHTRTISPVPAPTTIDAREAEQSAAGGGAAVKEEVFVPEAAPESTPALVAQGKVIYEANCLSCHNKNPSQPGSIGPAQAFTPWEVVKVKVVTGRYPKALPPGYTPARTTKAMRAFPKLEKDLPAIFSYLQSFK